MDTNNIEQMAREYKNTITTMPVFADSNGYLEQIIILNENQLDCASELRNNMRTPLGRKTVNYLNNLIYQSLVLANNLLNGSTYIPSFRNPFRCCGNSLTRIINSQLDIFILLDKLTPMRTDLGALVDIENRKMAILASF